MELPALKLPEIPLPFEIPTLMHPPADHFAVAIPVLVLFIEIVNLFAKKRAIGFISFFLLLIGAVAAVAAYLTGLHDGQEAFDALTQAGQEELKEHRILGTYLMLASGVVVVFKLLSAMIRRGLMKATYLLVLIVFVAGILKQGKDGGELVYEYGANVERVQDVDSELFDAKEELDEANEKIAELKSALQEAQAAKTATEAKAAEAQQETTSSTSVAPVETQETETPQAPVEATAAEKAEALQASVEKVSKEAADQAAAPVVENATHVEEAVSEGAVTAEKTTQE